MVSTPQGEVGSFPRGHHVSLHGYDEAGIETLLDKLPYPCRRRILRPLSLPLSADLEDESTKVENENSCTERTLPGGSSYGANTVGGGTPFMNDGMGGLMRCPNRSTADMSDPALIEFSISILTSISKMTQLRSAIAVSIPFS